MASKRRQRRKACEGKVRYSSSRAAHNEAMRRGRESGHRLNGYKCAFCNGFHIGHPPKRVRQAIRARRDR